MTKQKIISFLKNNKFDIQSARASMLAVDACYQAYVNADVSKNSLSPMLCFIEPSNLSSNFSQITSKKVLKVLARELYEKFLKNKGSFYNNFHSQKEISNKIDAFWKKYQNRKIGKETPLSEVAVLFDNFANLFDKWWTFSAFGEDKGQTIFEDFLPGFAKRYKISLSEAQQRIFLLTHPEGKAIFNQEREDFFNICLNYHDKQKLKKLIESYIKKYFWIKTDFCKKTEVTSKLIIKEVEKELKEKTKGELKIELQKMRKSVKDMHKQKEEIFGSIKPFIKDKKYFEFASFMIGWQDYRKAMMMKTFYYLFSLVEDISKITKVSYENAVSCFLSEFKDFLKTGTPPINRKGQLFIFYEKGKNPLIFRDNDIIETVKMVLGENMEKTEEISGMVASTGKVERIKGIVKVISNPEKQEFNKGEILVTSMTRVEFVPMMKKSLAVITNEGGIACHAAIVSRELGIPCIIGTKIATKVFKDGDLVEIDTKKGVTKIIKKK